MKKALIPVVSLSMFALLGSCRQSVTPPVALAAIPVHDVLAAKRFIAIHLSRNIMGDLVVKVRINNDTAVLVVDTGASQTCIDDSSAHRMGIVADAATGEAAGVGGGGLTMRLGNVDIQLDSLTIPSLDLTIMDMSHVNKAMPSPDDHIDGVLGADVLAKYQAVIDYNTNTLYLKK